MSYQSALRVIEIIGNHRMVLSIMFARVADLASFFPFGKPIAKLQPSQNDLRRQSVVHQIEAYLRKEFSDTSVPSFPTINILR